MPRTNSPQDYQYAIVVMQDLHDNALPNTPEKDWLAEVVQRLKNSRKELKQALAEADKCDLKTSSLPNGE